jgi:hypothetical protein
MIGLDTDLKQTRFSLEISEEERKAESIKLLSRQLRRKFGLQPELDAALQQLPNIELEQLEDLAYALQDFKVVGDLQAWFHMDNL